MSEFNQCQCSPDSQLDRWTPELHQTPWPSGDDCPREATMLISERGRNWGTPVCEGHGQAWLAHEESAILQERIMHMIEEEEVLA